MGAERFDVPLSPTAIGLATGMDVPGGLGAGEEADGLKAACPEPAEAQHVEPAGRHAASRAVDLTDVIPGQSGAEALTALPDDAPAGF